MLIHGHTNIMEVLQPDIWKETVNLREKFKPHNFHYIAIVVKIGPPIAARGWNLWGPFLVWYLWVPICSTQRFCSSIWKIFGNGATLTISPKRKWLSQLANPLTTPCWSGRFSSAFPLICERSETLQWSYVVYILTSRVLKNFGSFSSMYCFLKLNLQNLLLLCW